MSPKKAKDEPGTAVATTDQPTTALAQMPDLREMSTEAKQDFAKDELTIPFLRVIQSNSPQCTQGDPQFMKDARPGMLINTVTKRLYNVDGAGVLIIPVFHQTSYTEWRPRGEGGGGGQGFVKDWGSDPSGAGPTKRNEKNKEILANGNELTRSSMYYALVVDENGSASQVVLALQGTQLKKARAWNALMKEIKFKDEKGEYNPSTFAMTYNLTTVPEKNDQGSWMGVKIEPRMKTGDLPGGGPLLYAAFDMYKLASKGQIKTSEVVEAEVTSAADGGDEAF